MTKGELQPKPGPAELRQRAEQRLKVSREDISAMKAEDIQKLIHELQVHQVELEIQNEELRRAQQELAEARDRYADLYQSAPVAYLTLDSQFAIRQANQTAAAKLGTPIQAMIGQQLGKFLHPDDADACYVHLREVADGGGPRSGEFRLRRPDGSWLWVVKDVNLAESGKGEPELRVTIRDITASKQTEAALRESERFIKSVAEASPHWYYVFDLDEMALTYTNRPLLRDLGYPPEMETTKLDAFRAFMPSEEMPHLARLIEEWRALPDGHIRDDEYVLRSPDGTLHHFAGREIVFARRPDGTVRQIIGSLLDITDRKQAEQALLSAKDDLEKRVAERTAELSQTIHTLQDEVARRTLAEHVLRQRGEQLRALTSELTLVEQRERRRLAEVLHDNLQQLLVGTKFRLYLLDRSTDLAVKEVVEGLHDLLDQSIEVSRSLTGELSPPILYHGGLVPALEWLAVWMQQKHDLTVQLQVQESAAPQSEDLKVLLFQSVRELLFNVVKHARVNVVEVRLRALNDHIEITVADNGVGFDPQAVTPQAGKPGGFGLFSIRERLDLLGGKLEIDSAPGRGSRFTLLAPRHSTAPTVTQLPSTLADVRISRIGPIPLAGAARVDHKIRVLLVDDHVVVRQGLSHLLREEPDIEVVAEASDGQTAVDMVRHLQPDVVMMDINMPGMNGVEATGIIHAEFPDVRVIGLSMFDEDDRARAMREAGAVNYLTKSGPADTLIAAIRACAKA